jgi:hypothetical protein
MDNRLFLKASIGQACEVVFTWKALHIREVPNLDQ